MTADDESHGAALIDIIEKRMQENAALRAENQRLLALFALPIAFVEYGPKTASLSLMFMGEAGRAQYVAELRRALESDNAND